MDNDRPEDRRALIEELGGRGIKAYEWTSGGGIMHVAAPLHEEGEENIFQVATGSAETDCEVFLMGWRGGGGVETPPSEWIHPGTIGEAADAFESFFTRRGEMLERYRSGDLDV